MILSDATTQLRMRNRDWVDPDTIPVGEDPPEPRWRDPFYWSCLNTALSRLNGDLAKSYTFTNLPVRFDWAVLLLAWIEVLKTEIIRGTDTDENAALGSVQRVQVPDNEVWYHTPRGATGDALVKLQKQLVAEYRQWLEDNGFNRQIPEDVAGARSYPMTRVGARQRFTATRRANDIPLEAPSDLQVEVASDGLVLTWSPVREHQLSFVAVQRMPAGGTWRTDVETLAREPDPHADLWVQTSPAAGSWVYRLGVQNRNGLVSYSNEVEVEVL